MMPGIFGWIYYVLKKVRSKNVWFNYLKKFKENKGQLLATTYSHTLSLLYST